MVKIDLPVKQNWSMVDMYGRMGKTNVFFAVEMVFDVLRVRYGIIKTLMRLL